MVAAQPVPPAIKLHENEEYLQGGVRPKARLPDNDEEDGGPDDSDRELPQAPFDPEDHAGKRHQRRCKF
jgi:hypothetical protein